MSGAWRPAEGHDYDALTLRDKIREHLNLAARAELRAGPMWTNKGSARALRAEEMSPAWHDMRKIARYHYAEVEQLKKRIVDRESRDSVEPDLLRDRVLTPDEAHAAVDGTAPRPGASAPDLHGALAPGSALTPQMLRVLGRAVPSADGRIYADETPGAARYEDDPAPAEGDGAW